MCIHYYSFTLKKKLFTREKKTFILYMYPVNDIIQYTFGLIVYRHHHLSSLLYNSFINIKFLHIYIGQKFVLIYIQRIKGARRLLIIKSPLNH